MTQRMLLTDSCRDSIIPWELAADSCIPLEEGASKESLVVTPRIKLHPIRKWKLVPGGALLRFS